MTAPPARSPAAAAAAAGAPAWFRAAVAQQPSSHFVTCEGVRVHYLRYGPRVPGRRGLLFLHGGFAHARWWDFIAPFFAAEYDVVAADLLGCGDTDHLPTYDMRQVARLCVGRVCEDAGLAAPFVVGHSMGASVALRAAAGPLGAALGGVVALDPVVRPAALASALPPAANPNVRYYATKAELVRRFKLMPPQECENGYILRYVAEQAARHDDGKGWALKTDTAFTQKIAREWYGTPEERAAILRNARCRVGVIYGAASQMYKDPRVRRFVAAELAAHPRAHPAVEVPAAAHHVTADQPLAVVSALRALLALWAAPSPPPHPAAGAAAKL